MSTVPQVSPSCNALAAYLKSEPPKLKEWPPTSDVQKPGGASRFYAEELAVDMTAALRHSVRVGRYSDGCGHWCWGLHGGDGFGDVDCAASQRFLRVRSLRGGDLVLHGGRVYSVSSRGVAAVDWETGSAVPCGPETARMVVEYLAGSRA